MRKRQIHRRPTALLPAGVVTFVLQALARAAALDTDPDTRAHTLSEQLRCLVCQNQILADSNADPAIDLYRQIREQLRAGAAEANVKGYLVQRYGDFILYRSSIKRLTYLLWFGPVLLLMVMMFGIVSSHKQQKPAPSGLDADAQARLAALLVASPPEDSHQ